MKSDLATQKSETDRLLDEKENLIDTTEKEKNGLQEELRKNQERFDAATESFNKEHKNSSEKIAVSL